MVYGISTQLEATAVQSPVPGTALGLGLVKTRPHAAVCGSSLAFVETQLSLEGGIAVTHYMLIISLSLSFSLCLSLAAGTQTP